MEIKFLVNRNAIPAIPNLNEENIFICILPKLYCEFLFKFAFLTQFFRFAPRGKPQAEFCRPDCLSSLISCDCRLISWH